MNRLDSSPPLRFDRGIRLDSQAGPTPGPTKKHTMAEPALKLALLDTNGVKILGGSIASGLTGNPTLVPAPKVLPAQILAAVKDISDQEVILAAAEANVSSQGTILDNLVEVLKGLITKSVDDSTVEVDYDGTKMGMLNIPTKGAGTPVPVSGPPQNFSVTQGDHTTEADGHCDRVRGAIMYRAEHAASPAGPWVVGYEGKKSKFTIAGLPVMAPRWFRMAAFAGGEWSDWSDVASCGIL